MEKKTTTYYCEICNRYFPKADWLQNHLKGKPHAKVVADLAKKEAEAAGKQPAVAVASQKEVPKGLVPQQQQQSEEDWLSPLVGLPPYNEKEKGEKEEEEKAEAEETPLPPLPPPLSKLDRQNAAIGAELKRKLEEEEGKPPLAAAATVEKKKKVEEQVVVCCVTDKVWGKLVIPCTVSFKNM